MKRLSLIMLLTCLIQGMGAFAAEPEKPNVILFLVDDMGWVDSTPYGSTYYETPQMERFARQSLRFTQAYAMPLCSPTRACLLSGQSAARHGITAPAGHSPPRKSPRPPITASYLDPEQYTLAEALRDAGYRTGHFGKWHLGLTEPHWPEAQGFEVAFHCEPSAGPPGEYFSPYRVFPPGVEKPKLIEGRSTYTGTITDGPDGEYITDRLTDESIRFIRDSKAAGKPFFLNLWHYAVHGPWGHKEDHTKAFAEKTDPSGRQGNPIMASMLKSVDESLGRLLDEIDQQGMTENTIVIFFSDNGGNIRSNTGEKLREMESRKLSPAFQDLLADWKKWAGDQPPTNNAPLRDGKGGLYEGGSRVPLMIRWPDRIPAGTTTDAIVHAYDFYPTLLELLGLEKAESQTFDGISFAPVLSNPKAGLPERPIFITAQNGCSVRLGDWKLYRDYQADHYELYYLGNDLSETNDLAAKQPEKVNELETLLLAHFEATSGVPRQLQTTRGGAASTEAKKPKDGRSEVRIEDAWRGDRRWIGPDWYAGPLQDWRITPDGLAATPRGPQRRFVHCVSAEVSDPAAGFDLAVDIVVAPGDERPKVPAAGIALATRGTPDNLLHAAVYPDRFLTAGITHGGRLVLGGKVSPDSLPGGEPIRLNVRAQPVANGVRVELTASRTEGTELARLEDNFEAAALEGAFGVFVSSNRARDFSDPDPDRFAIFRHFSASGPGLEARPENRFGPILWSQYTCANGLLRIQAQLPPLEPTDAQVVRLEIQMPDGKWERVATASVEPASSTALLEVDDWDASKSVPYRLRYQWNEQSHLWHGEIRREPSADEPWKLGLFSCDAGYLFPLAELVDEVRTRDPDMLFFAGDQFYEGFGGFLFTRDPIEIARLDYLRKWYLFGWTNRHLLKDRPSVIIPDDHDVFQGNLWGQGGREIPNLKKPRPIRANFGLGGYAMAPDWVHLAERCQTGHLPDPYDPSPVEQGIGVYYTGFSFGGVSFAVLEDRKFKTGAAAKVSDGGEDDLVLLGDRQIDFLEAWAQDWSGGATMKCVLSQTIFAQPVTHAGDGLPRRSQMRDNNAWPESGRNLAVQAIRKSAAFSLHGDQHLPLQLRHGIDDWEDAGVAFMGPATVAGFPRAWWPDEEATPGSPIQGTWLGRYRDDFGHPITIDAVANPTKPDTWPGKNDDPVGIAMHKSSGYAMVQFDPAERTMTTHCYPLPYAIDPARVENGQYKGWPLTFSIEDNDGREPLAHLPEQTFDIDDPVVGLFDAATGQLIYARRIRGRSFTPPVFAPGKYEVRWGQERPETSLNFFDIDPDN